MKLASRKVREIDAAILEYATPRQRELVESAIQHGSFEASDKINNVSIGCSAKTYGALVVRAAKLGFTPSSFSMGTNQPGFATRRISTHIDKDGKQSGWHIQEPDKAQMQKALEAFRDGLIEEIKPAKPSAPAKLPKGQKHLKSLMTGIFVGDAHIGCRAYGKETRHNDFDTDIATAQLREAADYLVEKAEPTQTGVLFEVGDFMHQDNGNDTTTAGTRLDSDTRYSRVMMESAMTMRYFVDRMLTKFQKVIVVIARGNHNDNSAIAIRGMIDFYYSKDPRVTVLDNQSYYQYFEFGKWLFGIHHGHKQKPTDLVSSMARDMAKAWGRTTYRMWVTGHYHQTCVTPLKGCEHRVFGALPPPDSWHASMGYGGHGSLEMITFRREGGIYSSHVFNSPMPEAEPDMVAA